MTRIGDWPAADAGGEARHGTATVVLAESAQPSAGRTRTAADWSRLWSLAPDVRNLLVVAAMLQLAIRALLPCIGVARAAAITARAGRCPVRLAHGGDRIAWAVAASGSRLGTTCLVQALAARVCAAWAGVPVTLVIGARIVHGGPRFHAWLEGLHAEGEDACRDGEFVRLTSL